jgi:hypothetical protein
MANKGPVKGHKKSGSGARRMPSAAHTKYPVPAGESKKESGQARLYAPVGSARSTSTTESGPRRLYRAPAYAPNAAGRKS